MKKINLLLAMSAFAFFACNQQPQGENAEVSEAKDVKEAAAEAVNYSIDIANSNTNWIGSKPVGKHSGTIAISEGNLSVAAGEITGGKVTIDMNNIASIDLADDADSAGKLIGHLKSADFFDVENNPTAEFVITSVQAYDATDSVEVKEEFESEFKPASADEFIVENPTHKVTGNLTLRGTTLSIAFPAKITVTEGTATAEAKFNIDRTLWGVMYGDEASAADKAKDKFVYNTVNIGLSLSANQEASTTEM
jgi:polyisoprenoid-binding protein YceI